MVCTLAEERLDRTNFPEPAFHNVEFGGKLYTTFECEGWVSFHRSLHWPLAELLKHADRLSEEGLKTIGIKNGLQGVFAQKANEYALLTVIDFPLRGSNIFIKLECDNLMFGPVLSMIVIPPKPFGVSEGPYQAISDVWESAVIIQIIFYALLNVLALTDAVPSGGGPGSFPPF